MQITNMLDILRGSIAFVFIVGVLGCATPSADIMKARNALTYDDLKGSIEHLECKINNQFKECMFNLSTFDVLLLEDKKQTFSFVINANGQIIDRHLHETLTEYHWLPRFQLPGSFQEFK